MTASFGGLNFSAALAAALSGVAALVVAISLPMVLQEITGIEYELSMERARYADMSNKMWHDLMEQSRELNNLDQLRRARRDGESN